MKPEFVRSELWEHASAELPFPIDGPAPTSRLFRAGRYCYEIRKKADDCYSVHLGYFIGVDWLVEGHSAIVVAPKLDTRVDSMVAEALEIQEIELDKEPTQADLGTPVMVDYFAILRSCLSSDVLYNQVDDLVQIDWRSREIPIEQEQDWLSPLLIVKYLNILHSIVRKGLKNSYYTVTSNLQGKVKGKILVSNNIKQNVVKNRPTHTVCSYQEFGIDTLENRLLKKALEFAVAYISNNKKLFGDQDGFFDHLVNYCRPAFEHVRDDVSESDVRHYKPSPFYREYKDGIKLAKLILKRYSYSISKTSEEIVPTPPYWIDMPKLFELYTYHFLKARFPGNGEVKYHYSTYGNELDFLIKSDHVKLVVDAKYKPRYEYRKYHDDMRQISGYSRLHKVRRELGVDNNQLVDCLIVYPKVNGGLDITEFKNLDMEKLDPISEYERIYKVGIQLPIKSKIP